MATVNFDGTGAKTITATAYTLVIYEQEFKRDMIKDVFGRIDLRRAAMNYDRNGNVIVQDFTMDDWNAELRALWALLKTESELARMRGESVTPIPSFTNWVMSIGRVDMQAVSAAVVEECQRGFFRTDAAPTKEQ